MKKTILLSSIFAVSAAVAGDVTSGNAIGALNVNVTKSDSQKQTLLAVPFVGYAGDAVAVQDMVKTSNLDDGSKLYVPTSSGVYNTWTLQNNQWVADNQVTVGADGQPVAYQGEDAGESSVNRGDSFWLEPKFKDSNTSGTVFLLGQGETSAGTSTAVAGWNLIGNASVATKELDVTGTQGDMIVAQVDGKLRYYKYSTKYKWQYQNAGGDYEQVTLSIAPGQGLWYYNKGTKDLPINW